MNNPSIQQKPESAPGQLNPATFPPEAAPRQPQFWTPLIYALLSTEPWWCRLPDPAPLFAEELLQALLEAEEQNAS